MVLPFENSGLDTSIVDGAATRGSLLDSLAVPLRSGRRSRPIMLVSFPDSARSTVLATISRVRVVVGFP